MLLFFSRISNHDMPNPPLDKVSPLQSWGTCTWVRPVQRCVCACVCGWGWGLLWHSCFWQFDALVSALGTSPILLKSYRTRVNALKLYYLQIGLLFTKNIFYNINSKWGYLKWPIQYDWMNLTEKFEHDQKLTTTKIDLMNLTEIKYEYCHND